MLWIFLRMFGIILNVLECSDRPKRVGTAVEYVQCFVFFSECWRVIQTDCDFCGMLRYDFYCLGIQACSGYGSMSSPACE